MSCNLEGCSFEGEGGGLCLGGVNKSSHKRIDGGDAEPVRIQQNFPLFRKSDVPKMDLSIVKVCRQQWQEESSTNCDLTYFLWKMQETQKKKTPANMLYITLNIS